MSAIKRIIDSSRQRAPPLTFASSSSSSRQPILRSARGITNRALSSTPAQSGPSLATRRIKVLSNRITFSTPRDHFTTMRSFASAATNITYALSSLSASNFGLGPPGSKIFPRLMNFSLPFLNHLSESAASTTGSGSSSLLAPTGASNLTSGDVHLILPPNETRPHRYITLPNGLDAIIIHDPECDKAAAAMDVGVGHLEDPVDLPGCAHFCEHLMFLGTAKYPQENAYSTYLSANNGHSNAYTALCSTNYYFDVAPDALEGALDRFAGFFVEPLFAADCTEREIKAVDSEHKKNVHSDMWRFYQLEKHLSSPTHPYNKFGTGDAKTLWERPIAAGRDPRAELIEWWRKTYCARRMKLVLMGRNSLDEMEAWVRQKFEKVPVRTQPGQERIVYSSEVIDEAGQGTILFTRPVKDMRGLEITFPFPDQDPLWRTKPSNYIAHFLGHEGPGSVLSYLKRHGWVNSLRAGPANGGNGFDFFKVTVDLTPDGLEHYRDVALVVCKYINLLKASKPSHEIFREIKALADIGFRFVERGQPSSYVSEMAGWMHNPSPKEKTISSQWLVESFDPEEVEGLLQLLDVSKARIAVTAKEMPKGVGILDQKEPIYGTEYRIEKLEKQFLGEAQAGEGLPGLALPGLNSFIPENLDVQKIAVKETRKLPALIRQSPLSKLWYKKDDQFWVPRANVFVALRSPIVNMTPRNAVLARVFCDLFRDFVTEEVYDAEMAGLQYSMDFSGDSITIGSQGYNDKLPKLTEKMLGLMKEFKVVPERLELVRDTLRRHWVDFNMEEPYQLTAYYAHYVEAEKMWTPEEKVVELAFVKPRDVENFIQDFLERLHIETLVHGNMEKEDAIALQETVERVIQPRALAPAERISERSLTLPDASEHIWKMDVPNPANGNSCIEYYCEVGDVSDTQLRPQLSLLAQILNEPCFDQLRTKEQLGYLVFSGARAATGTMGLRILVQSERTAVYLETRIEAFLDYFKTFLEDMTEEAFASNRQALINKKQEKPKNLHGESSRFWNSIGDGYYDYLRRDKDAAVLANVSKQDIIQLFMTRIHPSSATRRKLSIHMASTFKGAKPDQAKATALLSAFKQKQVSATDAEVGALMASSPTLQEIQKFALVAIGKTKDLPDEDKVALEKQVGELGEAAKEEEVKVRESNVIVTDVLTWKAGLIPSKAATPLMDIEVEV